MTRAELPLAISWRMVARRRKGIFFIPKLPPPIRPTTVARRRKGIFLTPPFFKAQPYTVPTIVTKAHTSHWVFPFKFDFNSYLRFCYKKTVPSILFFLSLYPLKKQQKICSLCLYVLWKNCRKYVLYVFMSSKKPAENMFFMSLCLKLYSSLSSKIRLYIQKHLSFPPQTFPLFVAVPSNQHLS